MNDPLLTAEEWARVQAYDERTRREIDDMEKIPALPDTLKEWREDLEESRLDDLRELQKDIAALIRVRDRWPNIQEIQDRVFNLITQNRLKIDELRKEIKNAGS
jgi:hypothetical protein